jgi:diacylglycerol kinase family enzyme
MDVVLFYSEAAGDGVGLTRLRQAVTGAGHKLVHVVERHHDPESLLDVPADLVVAAGGDGTVGAAARALAGRGVPLAVMPIGTANNVARSLGIDGEPDDVAAGWHTARRRPLDLGRVRLPEEEVRFLEAVGGGLIAAGIAAHQARPGADTAPVCRKIPDALRAYRDALDSLEACRCRVSVDGDAHFENLLLFEVLNIRSIGPRLELASNVDSSDGRLSVVTASPFDRDALRDYLRAREGEDEDPGPAGLMARSAREVTIRGWDRLHVDDRIVDIDPDAPIELSLEPAALDVLTPA